MRKRTVQLLKTGDLFSNALSNRDAKRFATGQCGRVADLVEQSQAPYHRRIRNRLTTLSGIDDQINLLVFKHI